MKVGDIFAELGLKMNAYMRNLESARAAGARAASDIESRFKQSSDRIGGYFKDVSRIISGIVISQAFYQMLQTARDAASALFQFNNELQRTHIAMTRALGSARAADAFIAALNEFAAQTPFNFSQLEQLSVKLKGFGFEAKSVIPVLRILGDTVAGIGGTTDTLDGIALALGQINRKAVVSAEELNQLAERGINGYQILQEELGLTAKQLTDIGNAGIRGSVAVNAILRGLEKRYSGMMLQMSKTSEGALENIRDNALQIGNIFLAQPFEELRQTLVAISERLSELSRIGRDFGPGGIFEAVVPERYQAVIRAFLGSLMELGSSFARLWAALKPVREAFASVTGAILGVAAPAINMLAGVLNLLATILERTAPLVQILATAFLTLRVAAIVTRGIIMLSAAIRTLMAAETVARGIAKLAASITVLKTAAAAGPVGLAVLGGVLAGLAIQGENASAWLDTLYQKILKLSGLDIGEILQPTSPKDLQKEINEYLNGVARVADQYGDVADEAEDATKQTKKFIAAFDEVYQIPEDALEKIGFPGIPGGNLDDIEPLPIPELPSGGPGSGGSSPGFWNIDFPKTIMLPELKWPDTGSPPAVHATIDALVQRFNALPQQVAVPLGQVITSSANAFQGLRSTLESTGSTIYNAVKKVFDTLPSAVVPGIKAAENEWKKLWNTVNGTTEVEGKSLQVNWRTLLDSLKQAAEVVVPIISTPFSTLWNAIRSAFNTNAPIVEGSWNSHLQNKQAAAERTSSAIEQRFATTWDTLHQQVATHGPQYANEWSTTNDTIATNASETTYEITDYFRGLHFTLSQQAWEELPKYEQLWYAMFGRVKQQTEQVVGQDLKKPYEYHFNFLRGDVKSWWNNFVEGIWKPYMNDLGIATENLLKVEMPKWWNENKEEVGVILSLMPVSWGPKIASWASKMKPFFDDVFAQTRSWWTSWIDDLGSRLGNFLSGIGSRVQSVIDSISNIKIPSLPSLGGSSAKVPGAATGGIVTRHQLIQVGEGNKAEAIIPLENERYMRPFSDAVANAIVDALGNSLLISNSQPAQPTILYVGTLIADDRSLKELSRRMEIIQIEENARKGLI